MTISVNGELFNCLVRNEVQAQSACAWFGALDQDVEIATIGEQVVAHLCHQGNLPVLVDRTLSADSPELPRLGENVLPSYDWPMIWEAGDGAFHRGWRPAPAGFSA